MAAMVEVEAAATADAVAVTVAATTQAVPEAKAAVAQDKTTIVEDEEASPDKGTVSSSNSIAAENAAVEQPPHVETTVTTSTAKPITAKVEAQASVARERNETESKKLDATRHEKEGQAREAAAEGTRQEAPQRSGPPPNRPRAAARPPRPEQTLPPVPPLAPTLSPNSPPISGKSSKHGKNHGTHGRLPGDDDSDGKGCRINGGAAVQSPATSQASLAGATESARMAEAKEIEARKAAVRQAAQERRAAAAAKAAEREAAEKEAAARAAEARAAREEEVRAQRNAERREAAEKAKAEAAADEKKAAAERAAMAQAEAAEQRVRDQQEEKVRAERAAVAQAEAAERRVREQQEESARARIRQRALTARKRVADGLPAGMTAHRAKYGMGEQAPLLTLLPGDAVLLRDCPAPSYAAWAVITRINSEGVVVMRDLGRLVLRRGAQPAATGAMEHSGAPDGYWAENSCLPLRCGASGAWTLPTIDTNEIICALPAEDYAALNSEDERPAGYVSFGTNVCRGEGSPDKRQPVAWQDEPHAQILVAARREISMWAAAGEDLGEALAALWPELERGYSMLRAHAGPEKLPAWHSSFLEIPDEDMGTQAHATSDATSPFFTADTEYLGLI